jgi:hypothetical protein
MRLYMHVFVNIYIVFAYIMNSVSLKTTLAVSLGCLHDDVRAEPGSWLVVGMIPVFDKRKAQRAGRPLHGPHGTARRRIALMHQCLSAVLEGWNVLSMGNKILQWADGTWRRTRLLITAFFMDQPEADTYCCDTAQSCKLCHCPKHRLHEPVEHPPKHADAIKAKVERIADGYNISAKRLFRRRGTTWTPTDDCKPTLYEKCREATGGVHIMPNALWDIPGCDVQHCVSTDTCRYIDI